MLRKSTDDLFENGIKGDWCFTSNNEDMYIFIMYGHTTFDICSVKVKGTGCWEWDGNMESPTLFPSLLVFNKDATLWHGFMKKGILTKA